MQMGRAVVCGALLTVLSTCVSQAQDGSDAAIAPGAEVGIETAPAAAPVAIDPQTYAGRVQIKLSEMVTLRDIPVPFTVYAGLVDETPTRMRLNALMDLRGLQDKAPALLTGPLEDSCNRQIYLDVTKVSAIGEAVRVEGSARARFSTCNRREEAGWHYFGATVDAIAVGKAEVENKCLAFSLEALDLSPRGFIGGVSNLFGLTRRINEGVLDLGNDFLAENPVCPPLPREFSVLDPTYDGGGTREIGSGGMGATISGSVDASASTLIALLAELKALGVLEFVE